MILWNILPKQLRAIATMPFQIAYIYLPSVILSDSIVNLKSI